jgi:zinc transport system substrate-binding protein
MFLRRLCITAVASLPLLCCIALLSGCGGSSEPLNPGKVTAFVSVPPQATVVQAIGGERVVVETLAGAGKDPHDFSPSTRQTVSLGRAEVWFTTRMPFERGMKKKVGKNAKSLKIVDITEGAPEFPESQPTPDHEGEGEDAHADHHDHDHDHHHHHDHSAGDPHLWLAPAYLKSQAQLVAASLSELDPTHASEFAANLKAFEQQLDDLDAELEKTLAPHKGATFLAYHGAFAWFADAYGLKQEVIEFAGKAPETKSLLGIIEKANAAGIRVVFTQPQYDPKSAQTVAAGLNGKVVNIDPLAADLFSNLRSITNELAAALASQAEPPTPSLAPGEGASTPTESNSDA